MLKPLGDFHFVSRELSDLLLEAPLQAIDVVGPLGLIGQPGFDGS